MCLELLVSPVRPGSQRFVPGVDRFPDGVRSHGVLRFVADVRRRRARGRDALDGRRFRCAGGVCVSLSEAANVLQSAFKADDGLTSVSVLQDLKQRSSSAPL